MYAITSSQSKKAAILMCEVCGIEELVKRQGNPKL